MYDPNQLSAPAESFANTAAQVADDPQFAEATANIMVAAGQKGWSADQIERAFDYADGRHRKNLKVPQEVLNAAYPLAAEAAALRATELKRQAITTAEGHTLSVTESVRNNGPLKLVVADGQIIGGEEAA